jgi:lipopolysaccharide biosynthesis regulator YciM
MEMLLWFLLPVAAASGWIAARRSARGAAPPKPIYDNNPDYFRGLNYLLNEEPDKAIDVFVQLLEVDSETVETHLALGSLFRRRGEVERAIRIHQNLIARPALSREQRAQALLELGQDYMRAGLFDRAENLFKELREMKIHLKPALRNLRLIYQQERDWDACLSVTEALQPLVGEDLGPERAHYYCELAKTALERRQHGQAEGLLRKALAADRRCTRAMHMQAAMASARGDYREAIRGLLRAADTDPDYFPELLPDLIEAHKRLGDLAGLRSYFEQRMARQPTAALELALADIVKESEGERAAVAYLSERVRSAPSLKGLLKLVEYHGCGSDAAADDVLIGLREHIDRLLHERPQYQCTRCGFSAKTLHWQCPSCRSWGSFKRRPEIEECLQVNP